MIKNIIFDIGNVILRFDINEVLNKYTSNKEDQKFIYKNIINSPEWLEYSLIDTGYITKEIAISLVQDRTNHVKDDLIKDFWNNYNNYALVDEKVLDLISTLKENNYKIYLLSNINPYTHEYVSKSNLFNLVDGYVLSYQVHAIKPHKTIYQNLINKYNINPEETLFLDDNQNNIDTGNSLNLISKKVEPDNYQSIINILKEYNLL
jgi:putative hydrolase of the HAD superfamily